MTVRIELDWHFLTRDKNRGMKSQMCPKDLTTLVPHSPPCARDATNAVLAEAFNAQYSHYANAKSYATHPIPITP